MAPTPLSAHILHLLLPRDGQQPVVDPKTNMIIGIVFGGIFALIFLLAAWYYGCLAACFPCWSCCGADTSFTRLEDQEAGNGHGGGTTGSGMAIAGGFAAGGGSSGGSGNTIGAISSFAF